MDQSVTIAAFDAEPAADALAVLAPCCASTRWQQQMVAGRPYGALTSVLTAADAALGELAWPDVEQALAAHPRIGQRIAGPDVESGWSRGEQSGTADAPDAVAEQLRAGNVAYERRFGHVYLVCATGRTAEQLLADLTERLGHDADAEQVEVRTQLRQIVRLRLGKAFDVAGAAA